MSEQEIPDYSGEESEPDVSAVERLGRLTRRMAELMVEEIDLEAKLKKTQKELKKYRENLIPDTMREIGAQTIETTGGMQIKLKEKVRASLPKDPNKRSVALQYLESTGNDGLLKQEFRIKYGRDSQEWAERFRAMLAEHGVKDHAVIEDDWTIHPQSLQKFIRDQLKEGKNVPLEDFGAFVQTIAEVKLP